jgi:hypothetical protein
MSVLEFNLSTKMLISGRKKETQDKSEQKPFLKPQHSLLEKKFPLVNIK